KTGESSSTATTGCSRKASDRPTTAGRETPSRLRAVSAQSWHSRVALLRLRWGDDNGDNTVGNGNRRRRGVAAAAARRPSVRVPRPAPRDGEGRNARPLRLRDRRHRTTRSGHPAHARSGAAATCGRAETSAQGGAVRVALTDDRETGARGRDQALEN